MAYYVYVVELKPHGSLSLRDRTHVYVGHSHLPPIERLEHHLQGKRASRHVRRHAIRLRPDLSPRSAFATRDAARQREKKLARELERRGYVVWGSCSPKRTPECVL